MTNTNLNIEGLMDIKKIALEVANEMYVGNGRIACTNRLDEFLLRCLAKIGEGLEPVGHVSHDSYSGYLGVLNKTLKVGTKLYATPAEAILAAEQAHRYTYGEDNDGWYVAEGDTQIAHGMSEQFADRVAALLNCNLAAEQRAAETCATAVDASSHCFTADEVYIKKLAIHAIRSGKWREYL